MRSLQTRVALAVALSMAATLAIVLVVVASTFATTERRALDDRVRTTFTAAARTQARPVGPRAARRRARRGAAEASLLARDRRLAQAATRNGAGVIVTDGRGTVLARYGLADEDSALIPLPRDSRPVDLETAGVAYRAARRSRALRLNAGGTTAGAITVLVPRAPTDARIRSLVTRVLVVGGGGLLLAIMLAVLAARLALGRLRRLAAQTTTLAPGTDERLPRGGPAEVDELAEALNRLLARVQASGAERDAALEASRRFAADAGHELRTPLTSMGADLRSLLDHGALAETQAEIVEDLAADHARLAALLAALQALARGDAGAAVPRAPVELSQLVDASLERARARHPGTTFARLPGDVGQPVTGWEDGLRLALENLLDNAALHGGATVSVRLHEGALVVEDDGPGIPEDERARVLGRFERGRSPRGPGSGLGLALVEQQARLHGGGLEIDEAPSGGARITLRLANDSRAQERSAAAPPATGGGLWSRSGPVVWCAAHAVSRRSAEPRRTRPAPPLRDRPGRPRVRPRRPPGDRQGRPLRAVLPLPGHAATAAPR